MCWCSGAKMREIDRERMSGSSQSIEGKRKRPLDQWEGQGLLPGEVCVRLWTCMLMFKVLT